MDDLTYTLPDRTLLGNISQEVLELAGIMRAADKNRDSRLSKEEFYDMATLNPRVHEGFAMNCSLRGEGSRRFLEEARVAANLALSLDNRLREITVPGTLDLCPRSGARNASR